MLWLHSSALLFCPHVHRHFSPLTLLALALFRHDYGSWPTVSVWTWSYEANSSIAFDMALSTFLLPYFCTLLGTAGVLKDVRDKKCDTVDPAFLRAGVWKYALPVRVRNLCMRSLAQGIFWVLLTFPPTILVIWMFVQGGSMSGLNYVIFKGIWAFIFVVPVFFIVFFAGLDKRNFPELEFEALMRLTAVKEGSADGPPLVGQVGHV